MNFEEFVTELKERIKDFLPEEYKDAGVDITEMQKLNQTYPALVVRRADQPAAASIDLDMMYAEYERHGMEEALAKTAALAQRQPEGFSVEELSDYEKARERLFIRVSNAETNKELLKDTPHREILGLAVTCHVLVGIEGEEMGSAMVSSSLLDQYGVTTNELFEDAFYNSAKILPPSIEPMEAMLTKMMGFGSGMDAPMTFEEQLEGLDLNRDGMAVLTNREAVNGASVIFYPEVMEKIGESQKVNLFILPSSTHEVILVPDNGAMKLKDLEGMVKSINASEVAAKDRLSDTVLHYDYKKRVLEKGSDYEDRMNSEAAKAKHKKDRGWAR